MSEQSYKSYKVSVLVPIFNVEEYIERCVRSIFEQTYENLEIILVDDCSPDKSIDKIKRILEEYPQRREQVKIIYNEQNRGSATSRNIALKHSTGEYIMYSDGDDWQDSLQVELLLKKAVEGNYDIVYSDYYESYPDKDKLIRQDCGTDKETCITAMLSGRMYCSNWNKIFKRSLYFNRNIFFIDGADMHEDMGVVVRLFAVADNIGYLPEAHYHYNQSNASSILRLSSSKLKRRRDCLQRIKNVETAISFLKQHNVWSPAIQHAAADCELRAKDELIDDTTYSLKRWIVTFPEADEAIWSSPFLNLNLRLLFTWLHFRQIWLYKLQKRITNICSFKL